MNLYKLSFRWSGWHSGVTQHYLVHATSEDDAKQKCLYDSEGCTASSIELISDCELNEPYFLYEED